MKTKDAFADEIHSFILDSANQFGLGPKSRSTSSNKSRPRKNLLLFSANHSEALKTIAHNYENYIEKHPDRLDDLAYTLARRREHLRIRNFAVTDGSTPFEVSPQTKSQGPCETAFVFTGQGAQWVQMGKQLMVDYPSFLANIRFMDEVLQSLEQAPPWTIEGM